MNTIKLSVVITTYNRRDVLARTLPTLFAQDLPAEAYEVIVVVDGSTDGTAEFLRSVKAQCAVRILEQPNRGQAAAQNVGLNAACGDLVLFLDDDILCDRGLLREHIAAHADADPSLVFGMVLQFPESPRTLAADWVRELNEMAFARLPLDGRIVQPYDATIEANSSALRSTLLAAGGFDEGRIHAHDDLGQRLWSMGVQFRMQRTAIVHELYVKSSRDVVLKDGSWYGRSEVNLCRKHPQIRPLSRLRHLAADKLWKRVYLVWAARLPVSPELILRAPFWVAERLRRIPWVRRVGIRLLEIRISIVMLRAALREAGSWEALQREFGIRLPVLLYHHVGPQRPRTYRCLTVSPERFERHISWLARRGYAGIRPSDWIKWRRDGKSLPDKPVLVTFDDGYADLAEYALPVLRRYGFGAAVYVVTGQLGGTNAWDEARGSGTHQLMTAEQIRYWATQGIEFGAHSRTHVDLTTLSAKVLTEEVIGSRDDLAELLGSRVASFAYPYGFQNQAVGECVRGAFDLAFLADDQTKSLNHLLTDPYLLQRTMIQPGDSLLDLECRIRWGHSPIQELRARLRLRTRLKRALRIVLGKSG
jgi:glycosyltransferase involved in cell wall biosynthesis/peptidoglycan/xylan/chitin deacetylase (PgdA/CDA1 family)